MAELMQLADRWGLGLVISAAVITAIWRFTRLLNRKVFGDPDAKPPQPGWVDKWVEADVDSKRRHAAANEANGKAITKMSEVLDRHDGFALLRTGKIDDLIDMGTNPDREGSAAETNKHVRQLRLAAIASLIAWANCVENPELRRDIEQIRSQYFSD